MTVNEYLQILIMPKLRIRSERYLQWSVIKDVTYGD